MKTFTLPLNDALILAQAAEARGLKFATESYEHWRAAENYAAAAAIWAQCVGTVAANRAADLTERAARQRFIDRKVNGTLHANVEG